MRITSTDLNHWADTREAQDQLPVLVRRLLRTTTPDLVRLEFPGGDAVRMPSFDGRCESGSGTPWCPKGRAAWEMGCNAQPTSKASADYRKRTDSIEEAERSEATFVFVTPRTWYGKDKWVTEKKAEGEWKDVRVVHGPDLETWLESSSTTELWLAERLGRADREGETAIAWFERWANAANPAIPSSLVVAGRERDAEVVLEQLRKNGLRALSIVGDDRGEAIAFVIAALKEADADDLLDRIVVTPTPGKVAAVPGGPRPIVIAALEAEHSEQPNLSEVAVVRAYPRGRLAERADISLRHVPAEKITATLREMGLGEEAARRHTRDSGSSLTVLRRRLSDDLAVRTPVWARSDVAVALVPFVLAGSWREGAEADIGVLELLADRPWGMLEDDLRKITALPDAPLLRFGRTWVSVSQIDTLFAVGSQLTAGTIEHFFEVAGIVFAERDPALDLPPQDWWSANILGKAHPYSGTLLTGLGDTLCILAVYGQALCGDRLGIDLQLRADRLVRGMLTDLGPEEWLSRRRLLRTFAEASPLLFLDRLEVELTKHKPAIESIMGVVDGGISGECLRTDLLWALESLAWEPRNIRRVCEILENLCHFKAEDNWSNKPFESLLSQFRPWLPKAPLDVEERVKLLQHLVMRDRTIGFQLCLSLLPRRHDSASDNARPRWRPYEAERRTVTYGEIWRMHDVARDLLIGAKPHQAEDLVGLIDRIDAFPSEMIPAIVETVEEWVRQQPDQGDLARVQDAVRSERRFCALRRRHGSDDEEDLGPREAALDDLLILLQPTCPNERYRWLFGAAWIEWPEVHVEEPDDHQDRDARVRRMRTHAVAEIRESGGIEGLVAFAVQMNEPSIVGETFRQSESDAVALATFVAACLRHPSRDAAVSVLKGVFWQLPEGGYDGLLSALRDDVATDQDHQMRIAESLPARPDAWNAIARLGSEAEQHFWSMVRVDGFWLEGADAETAADRLLRAGRPRTVLAAFHLREERLSARTWARVLDDVGHVEEGGGPLVDRHDLERIFSRLDASDDLTQDEIARLEWPFVSAFWDSGNRELALHRVMGANPEDFVQLLTLAFKRSDGFDEQPAPKHIAMNAYELLASWRSFPGLRSDGSVDQGAFADWNRETRKQAALVARLTIADVELGEAYAHAKAGPDGVWPPDPIRNLLDGVDGTDLRRGFATGGHNRRGVTSRALYEGGGQERALAAKYEDIANGMDNSHPRLAATMREIAHDYQRQAQSEDDRAAISERWHP